MPDDPKAPGERGKEMHLLEQAKEAYKPGERPNIRQIEQQLAAQFKCVEKTADIPSELMHFRLS